MGSFSTWHLLILGAVTLVLFGGRGKVSDLMGDFGRGISSFRRGLKEPDKEANFITATVEPDVKEKLSA